MIVLVAWIAIFAVPAIRRLLVTPAIMKAMARALPRMGDTERVALEAGTVWWDADLFSGRPDWQKLLDFQCPALKPEEVAFIKGPLEDLCRQIDDWKIFQERDLPPEIWAQLKALGLFGMI